MPSGTYHLFNVDDEKVTLQLNGKMIHPFSKLMLAHKWYSCNMLTVQSKLLMDSIIDKYALSRRAYIK